MISESSEDHKRSSRSGKRKKEKRRHRREEREMDDYNRESFKKMKEEIDELRKKEKEREKELENLKNMIESKEKEKEKEKNETKVEYALDFEKEEYLKKGFIESAKWIKNVISVNLEEKIKNEKHEYKFVSMAIAKKTSTHMGMRTCARFNRGEECNLGRWHMTHKEQTEPIRPKQLWTRAHQQHQQQHQFGQQYGQQQQQQHDHKIGSTEHGSRRNEIRLHACTLCMDTFGAAFE